MNHNQYGSESGLRGGWSDRGSRTDQKSSHSVLSGTDGYPALQTGLRRKQMEPEPIGLDSSNIITISISVAL